MVTVCHCCVRHFLKWTDLCNLAPNSHCSRFAGNTTCENETYFFYHTIFFVAYSNNNYVSPSYAVMTFALVSLTMHRPLASVTFNRSYGHICHGWEAKCPSADLSLARTFRDIHILFAGSDQYTTVTMCCEFQPANGCSARCSLVEIICFCIKNNQHLVVRIRGSLLP